MTRQLSKRTNNPQCILDRSLVNKHTITEMSNIGLSFLAPLCGRNRGVFVLDPPDGNTYGCISFPSNFGDMAGINATCEIKDANAINLQFLDGNISASDMVDLFDFLIESVYHTTPNTYKEPYGCEVGGLAQLNCGDGNPPSILPDGSPIRAVTVAGMFVPAPWMGVNLTIDDTKDFYSEKDFHEMKELGLNSVQIPVFSNVFEDHGDDSVEKAVGKMLDLVNDAGLSAILTLVQSNGLADNDKAVIAAARFVSKKNAVIAITLPSPDVGLIKAARSIVPTLPIFIPIDKSDIKHLQLKDKNVFAALDFSHTSTVGDIASSTSLDDRMKLFYHESTSCITRSPIEYATCYKNTPVLASNGFNLAIDDCIEQESNSFKDYGQCDRFQETIDSPWWYRHRKSFAERQVFAYERGLGWSFDSWKLYGEDSKNNGIIDTPVKLLSFKDVTAAGLMPSFTKSQSGSLSCLNPPESDFVLGDETLAPTPGPPPDCGNGWWNFETEKCDYWIPPPPIPCVPDSTSSNGTMPRNKALGFAALGGSVGIVFTTIILKIIGRKRGEYSQLI